MHRKFMQPCIVNTKDTIPICCVHGDKKRYLTTNMYIKVGEVTYLLDIVMADKLPYPIVLGQDLPVLFDLLELNKTQKHCAVVTRGQAKKAGEHPEVLSTLPFYNDELDAAPGKSSKTRRQRKKEKSLHTVAKAPANTQPKLLLTFKMPDNIIDMQKADPSLASLLQEAREEELRVDHEGVRRSIYYEAVFSIIGRGWCHS